MFKKKTWTTPAGEVPTLFVDMLEEPHLLIAGATGSGKSVLENGLLHTALYQSPTQTQFILIDPKRVELIDYKKLPHTLKYASEPAEMIQALNYAMEITENRYKAMQARHIKEWDGGHVYVVIDELADLMTTARNLVQPIIQRIGQIGRAAKVHLLACTQCPLAVVIPTPIKVNFTGIVGLRTATAQHSRNIIDMNGCELLPNPRTTGKANGYYKQGADCTLWNLPRIENEEMQRIINHWSAQLKPRRSKLKGETA